MVCPGFKNSIVCCNSWEFPDVCCDCDRSSSYFITCQYSSTLGLIEKEFLTFLHLEMQKHHLTVKRRASLQILFSIDYGSIYYDAALSLESMQAFYWTYLVCLLLIIHPHHEHGLNFLSFLFFFFLNNSYACFLANLSSGFWPSDLLNATSSQWNSLVFLLLSTSILQSSDWGV